MRYLYVDNFRGFTDTYVPFTDVNFLVGENSTGKTSILSLLKIISSPNFWFSLDFDIEEVKLGHFKDLVSAFANKRTYFQIGVYESQPVIRSKKEPHVLAFLMTFHERDGMPWLARCSYTTKGHEVNTQFTTSTVRWRAESLRVPRSDQHPKDSFFGEWTNSHRGAASKGFEKLTMRRPPLARHDLLEVTFLIERKLPASRIEPFSFRIWAFPGDLIWLAPIRTRPHRTYDEYKLDFSPEGEHTPYLIKRILSSTTEATTFAAFIDRVGKASGLFDSVAVKKYGTSATSPFELDVILNQRWLSISNVGYGVSQSLPVFVELFARPEGSWLAIQQPEVHLHPRAQAAIGDVLFELAVTEEKHFLVETHSDFLMDRFRLRYQDGNKKPSAQVLFFQRTQTGNAVYPLSIGPKGELPVDQPPAYREFFVREELQLLRLR